MSEAVTRKIVKALNWVLTKGTLKPYDACAVTKAKQKKVLKGSSIATSNMKKEESQIYLGIAAINYPNKKQVYKKNWHIMVDKRKGKKFTVFYDTEPTCAQL